MSAASLTMLVRLMVAQVQECVFEKMTLLRAQNDFLARLQLAQEAARVRILGRRGFGGILCRTFQESTTCCHHLLRGHPASHLSSFLSPQVEDVYSLVHQTMSQPHVKDYVPFSWTTMVQVKSEHFKALSHYFAAIALCDCPGECPAWWELPAHPRANSTSFLGFGEGSTKIQVVDTTPEVFGMLCAVDLLYGLSNSSPRQIFRYFWFP